MDLVWPKVPLYLTSGPVYLLYWMHAHSALLALLAMLWSLAPANGQVNITTGSYTQGFGTVDITSWSNNTTFPGWYAYSHLSALTSITHANITTAAPSNVGAFYSYECNGNNDQKLGSRASNTIPGVVGRYFRYGLYLRNTTGQTITSVQVRYTGYQFSLAENNGVSNRIEFHYAISAAVPSMTGAATAVTTLDYVAPNNNTGGTTLQLAGYPCTVFQEFNVCIPVNLPNNSYIMLRWSDINDTNNDHHLGIDNVGVDFGIDGSTSCDVLLPISLLSFTATSLGSVVVLDWTTASETDNDYFTVERSADGSHFIPVLRIPGAGNSITTLDYTSVDDGPLPDLSYYRLRQTDLDGTSAISQVVAVQRERSGRSSLQVTVESGTLTVVHDLMPGSRFALIDATGRLVAGGIASEERILRLAVDALPVGIYLLRMEDGQRIESVRFLL
jgi:hypothetical protein